MSNTSITNLQISDTFQVWVNKTNELIDLINENVMLAGPAAGFTIEGNSTLEGSFTANTINATTGDIDDISLLTLTRLEDSNEPIISNSPIYIETGVENLFDLQTTVGNRPILRMINGGNARWTITQSSAAAGASFIVSTEGVGTPQLTINQSGKIIANEFEGNVVGIASSADKLETSRTINGTSFDGTANITTVTWGTNRTITIGNTGKSVNGSDNVSWNLSEIGAAARTLTLTAGNGLTGGGDLTSNRTITLGTPDTVNGSSTNSVTATGHTHALSNELSRLDSISGSGIVVRNGTTSFLTRSIAGGDGINLTNGSGTAGNPSVAVDSTVVRTSRTVSAGNGLTGGGNLGADRTIALGTPSSITDTSTNSVTSTSHTHSISAGTIRTLIADSSPGQVGTYAFLMRNGGSLVAGDTIPGSSLFDAGIHVSINDSGFSSDDTTNANLTARQGTSRSGTWVAMGRSNGQSGTVLMRTTLFLRIA
jgi:hypothetical protein